MYKYFLGIFFIGVIIFFFVFNSSGKRVPITIVGSDTEVNLVSHLMEEFLKTTSKSNISTSVSGGGSGMGIATLINDSSINIANSSRDITDEEKANIDMQNIKIEHFILAMDAVCIIVNKMNKIKNISLKQLAEIYEGKITNWKDVGGDDLEISLYMRQSNSGTYLFFRNSVLKGEDYSIHAKSMNGNGQIVEGVKQDEAGIGYVGLGYVKNNSDVKVLSIKVNNNITNPFDNTAHYPLVRPLYQFIRIDALNNQVLKFLEFEMSKKGQEVVEKEGFLKVNKKGFITSDLKLIERLRSKL